MKPRVKSVGRMTCLRAEVRPASGEAGLDYIAVVQPTHFQHSIIGL